ncbi:DUF2061 domain-containing protein [Comamonas sp. lk]|uniref:DUF2061 domain-containing protein n=1 Tax=Comamonas sp. lk TaxID=2201272 RepID=UPI000EB3B0BE|nr:DUF2061 domain-containing protein [Comamonas sp. lk]
MTRLTNTLRTHQTTLAKTGSYYCIHVVVAACVAYAVTGNLWASLTLSLLEPTVQAVAFFFHEKAWDRGLKKRDKNEGQLAAGAA